MIKKLRMVEVEWVDSCIDGGWRMKEAYLTNEGVAQCCSIGYLLRSSRKEVMMVQSQTNSGKVSDSISIPRSCVKKMRYLEVKER